MVVQSILPKTKLEKLHKRANTFVTPLKVESLKMRRTGRRHLMLYKGLTDGASIPTNGLVDKRGVTKICTGGGHVFLLAHLAAEAKCLKWRYTYFSHCVAKASFPHCVVSYIVENV